ncbi:hypothetical protein H8356DRAFT_1355203 [Neocallimastix lanati (nom. inval.)]|nr:hypothetical protein H8356DRAFT_1355203 [Neocallimastix sp. JGI-2020a]
MIEGITATKNLKASIIKEYGIKTVERSRIADKDEKKYLKIKWRDDLLYEKRVTKIYLHHQVEYIFTWTHVIMYPNINNTLAHQDRTWFNNKVGCFNPYDKIIQFAKKGTITLDMGLMHMNTISFPGYFSLYGNKYFLIILDDYTGYNWVFFMKSESEVLIFISDYSNYKVQKPSIPYNSQQNGRVERLIPIDGIQKKKLLPMIQTKN